MAKDKEEKSELKEVIAAVPAKRLFAKTKIQHGRSCTMDSNGNMLLDLLVIEAGAEFPAGFDPEKEGLEEGVHFERAR